MSQKRTVRAKLLRIFSSVSWWRAFRASAFLADLYVPIARAATICSCVQSIAQSTGHPFLVYADRRCESGWSYEYVRGRVRPDLPIFYFSGISAWIDILFSRSSALITCTSLVDTSCGIFGHGMCIWYGVGTGRVCGVALGLATTCGCCFLSFVGDL